MVISQGFWISLEMLCSPLRCHDAVTHIPQLTARSGPGCARYSMIQYSLSKPHCIARFIIVCGGHCKYTVKKIKK